jgi:hypothetical protein
MIVGNHMSIARHKKSRAHCHSLRDGTVRMWNAKLAQVPADASCAPVLGHSGRIQENDYFSTI